MFIWLWKTWSFWPDQRKLALPKKKAIGILEYRNNGSIGMRSVLTDDTNQNIKIR
jgi:hypothetical protein